MSRIRQYLHFGGYEPPRTANMPRLNLKLCEPTGGEIDEETFKVLNDYLQPETQMTIEQAARSIVKLLPKDVPAYSTEVGAIGSTCIEVAEQIPYWHPSHFKLAILMDYLGAEKHFGGRYQQTGRYSTLGRLKEALVDNFDVVEEDNPMEHVNFHAFAANLESFGVMPTDPTWAIWMQRQVHESPFEKDESQAIHEAYVMAAAQWIIWYGPNLFKQLGAVPKEPGEWASGPLYDGKGDFSLHWWHFWRDGYAAMAGNTSGFGEECRNVAGRAAALMDASEKTMTF